MNQRTIRSAAATAAALLAVMVGCAPKPGAHTESRTTYPTGPATLEARVVVKEANPLVPGGEEYQSVPAAQIMLYRPEFQELVPPGNYWCEFQRFFEGNKISDYLLRSGWIILHDDSTKRAYRGRLVAAIPPPPPLTDASGLVVISRLPYGRYVMEMAAPHYQQRFYEFTLTDSVTARKFLTQETFLDLVPEYTVEKR